MICLCPQRSWSGGGQRRQEVWNWKKPKISLLGIRPKSPSPTQYRLPARLSISLCIFRLVSHLNTYAYLICHGFASGPCSKGDGKRDSGGDSRIRRMAYYIIDWIFVREFNKICKFPSFFRLVLRRTQSEDETSLRHRLSGSSAGED